MEKSNTCVISCQQSSIIEVDKNDCNVIILKISLYCPWLSVLPLFADRLYTHALLSKDAI